MTGPKTYKEKETEKQRGKKRYLERLVEEQEAEKEIDTYKEHHPNRVGDNDNYPEREH
jgi:hypothetical protein